MRKQALAAGLILLLFGSCSLTRFTAVQWKLKPGDFHETSKQHDWFFRGKGLFVSYSTVSGGEPYVFSAANAEVIRIVLEGSLESTFGAEKKLQTKGDCLYMSDPAGHSYEARDSSTVFLNIHFTGNRGNIPPSVSSGDIVNIDRLQFCQPGKGIDARIIQTASGHVSFLRLERDTVFPARGSGIERFLYVTRGKMDVTVDGTKQKMKVGDILYLAEDNTMSLETGPRGCDIIAVFTPGDPAFTRALDERMMAFHSIIGPGTAPVLLVDGETEQPGLTMSEGPSWMNGRLYFSNYYKYWKPWGSSDEGGVWIVEQDGSSRVLNKNVQTCGTTPLPNGKLAVCDLFARAVIEMDPETGEMGRTIADSFGGVPFAVANDIITDRKGGLYITDSSVAEEGPKQPGTALYYLNSKGETIRVTKPDEVDFVNGVVLTPDDRTLFLNGSREIYVYAFDVNPDGTLSNKRPFAKLFAPDSELDKETPSSIADGMTIDSDGNIYVATAPGIQVFDRAGEFIGIIAFPRITAHCVFGGPDMKTLYTTARKQIYSIRTRKIGLQYPIE